MVTPISIESYSSSGHGWNSSVAQKSTNVCFVVVASLFSHQEHNSLDNKNMGMSQLTN